MLFSIVLKKKIKNGTFENAEITIIVKEIVRKSCQLFYSFYFKGDDISHMFLPQQSFCHICQIILLL